MSCKGFSRFSAATLALCTTLVLTCVTAHAADVRLNWNNPTTNTDGSALYDLAGIRIYQRSQSASYGPPMAIGIATTHTVTGLSAGSAYAFRVTAVDTSGNESLASNEALISIPNPTPTPDTTAPSVPTGLNGTAVSQARIDLSWNASNDNVGVTGYRVLRNDVLVATVAGTSFSNTALAAGTAYSFRVAAIDAAQNVSAQSAAIVVSTLAQPTPTPSVTPSPSPTASPSPSPSPSPTASPSPSPTASPSPTVSPTASPTVEPTPDPTAPPSNAKARGRSDFDGDGRTDLTIGSHDKGMKFTVALTSGGVLEHTLGDNNSLAAPADYDGDGITDFAVVNAAGRKLNWEIESSASGLSSGISFGRFANTFLAGCNFTGDNGHELVVIRANGLVLFQSFTTGETSKIRIGSRFAPETQFGCADVNGDGLDEFIAAGPYSGESLLSARGNRVKRVIQIVNVATGETEIMRVGRVRGITTTDVDGDGNDEIGTWGSKPQLRISAPGKAVVSIDTPQISASTAGVFGTERKFGLLIQSADDSLHMVEKDGTMSELAPALAGEKLVLGVSSGRLNAGTQPRRR